MVSVKMVRLSLFKLPSFIMLFLTHIMNGQTITLALYFMLIQTLA